MSENVASGPKRPGRAWRKRQPVLRKAASNRSGVRPVRRQMTMCRPGKQSVVAALTARPARLAKKPTITAPDPIAFEAAAKALG